MFALPALISQGLNQVLKTLTSIPKGYYGVHHIVILSCFMALCRIKNAEQLKEHPPGELGKLLGLDRVPEVGHFRKKLKQVIDQGNTDKIQTQLFQYWTSDLPELFFYIDGHVRVYNGGKANLSKRFVSREKLCLSGTTEFWINDQSGMPLMVITGELNEKLKDAIELAIIEINKEIALPEDKESVRYTLVFDRESYEPKWFKQLWNKHQIAIITYRKNVKEKWVESLFKPLTVTLLSNDVTMRICEKGTQLSGVWFREIRKLTETGHQMAIMTTHPSLNPEQIASKMFSRWTQENFFKYMMENFAIDRMIEYGVEEIDEKRTLVNPQYRKLSYELKKLREKKRRLEAKAFKKLDVHKEKSINELEKSIIKTADLMDQIQTFDQEIEAKLKQRKQVPARISISQMPEEKKFNRLKQESKKFKNTILMLAYRAETTLYNLLPAFYKNAKKDGRVVLREIFSSDADITPDYKNGTLTITLHSLSTPRANEVVKNMCELLNQTQTIYPGTNLKMIFNSVAV